MARSPVMLAAWSASGGCSSMRVWSFGNWPVEVLWQKIGVLHSRSARGLNLTLQPVQRSLWTGSRIVVHLPTLSLSRLQTLVAGFCANLAILSSRPRQSVAQCVRYRHRRWLTTHSSSAHSSLTASGTADGTRRCQITHGGTLHTHYLAANLVRQRGIRVRVCRPGSAHGEFRSRAAVTRSSGFHAGGLSSAAPG